MTNVSKIDILDEQGTKTGETLEIKSHPRNDFFLGNYQKVILVFEDIQLILNANKLEKAIKNARNI